ncbi:hypothetical protein [Micrococcus sp.]|uniref:hypothetical protein n=1 Tax=Micrococcus sp. TaxID=1271 RepID=UPI002A90A6C1|nr:hypothetical protein [Micrococcus sp.]MDY6055095.1 hypothetical protein [Micrococcus sp.]
MIRRVTTRPDAPPPPNRPAEGPSGEPTAGRGGLLRRYAAVVGVIAVPAGLAMASEALSSTTGPPPVDGVSVRVDLGATPTPAQSAPAPAASADPVAPSLPPAAPASPPTGASPVPSDAGRGTVVPRVVEPQPPVSARPAPRDAPGAGAEGDDRDDVATATPVPTTGPDDDAEDQDDDREDDTDEDGDDDDD